jgi:Arc/MetJ-type ribon-helix-helix transcriptional regulator
MARTVSPKKDFATRLSPRTLEQLDALVRQGKFKTRTEVIETAVGRMFETEWRDPARLQRAFERACGALNLGGFDREAWRRAEFDRLEWEYKRNTGKLRRRQ